MKKITAWLLLMALSLTTFSGCAKELPRETTPASTTATTAASTEPEGEHMLNGKRVIYIGNSYTYYGRAVMEKARGVLTQEERSNDQGYFYQLCRANGAEVAVTNWTFGGHSFGDLFETCAADRGCDGVDHKSYLTDRAFDYVFLQDGSGSAELEPSAFLERCGKVMALFREANPEVKFVYLVQHSVHKNGYRWRPALKELENRGVTVVDWGALVWDTIQKGEVPGGEQQYFQNTFIISKSKDDGFHPNMLTGYLTALSAYCAITGESAVGQTYAFCNDSAVNKRFDFESFKSQYYTYDTFTNFAEVFASEADMEALQKLVDQYLTEKAYRNY